MRFRNSQRVVVIRDAEGNSLSAPGRVCRLRRCDDGAWVALDKRHPDACHPFAEGDGRGTHVLAYPEDCEALLKVGQATP